MIRRHQRGFTLLEVILSITIMSTLALISTQAITRALRARTKIQSEVDDVSALRDSARMIRTDVNMAFHHRDFEKEIQDIVKKPAAAAGITPGTSGATAGTSVSEPPREAKRIDPTTDFIGTESDMNFVTLNSGRLSSAALQADFIEVGYTLKDCRNLTTGKGSKCLYRRTQNILDEDVKAGGNEMVMLENVTEFKLRYIADTKQDWVSQWNSTSSSNDAGSRGRYPEAVEVSLSIEREFENKPRTYSMQLVIPVHFPNNSANKPSATGSTSPNNPPAQGGVIDQ